MASFSGITYYPTPISAHGPVADPWIALTAIAGATNHLRFWPARDPIATPSPLESGPRSSNPRSFLTWSPHSWGRDRGDWWREYSAVGEAADAQLHGAMLDEGLMSSPASGQEPPSAIRGPTTRFKTRTFCRLHNNRHAFRFGSLACGQERARFGGPHVDGVCPIGRSGALSPEDIRQMRAAIESHRTATTPFDIVLSGRAHEWTTAERSAKVADYAAAGVTWWLESCWADVALTEVRAIIDRGPPH